MYVCMYACMSVSLSLCRLSVTFVIPIQRVELSDTILQLASNSLRPRAVCIEIFRKKIQRVLGDRAVGMKNWVCRPISRFISKTVQDTTIVTTKDEQELVCDLSSPLFCHDII